jgi:hypothetical protein
VEYSSVLHYLHPYTQSHKRIHVRPTEMKSDAVPYCIMGSPNIPCDIQFIVTLVARPSLCPVASNFCACAVWPMDTSYCTVLYILREKPCCRQYYRIACPIRFVMVTTCRASVTYQSIFRTGPSVRPRAHNLRFGFYLGPYTAVP